MKRKWHSSTKFRKTVPTSIEISQRCLRCEASSTVSYEKLRSMSKNPRQVNIFANASRFGVSSSSKAFCKSDDALYVPSKCLAGAIALQCDAKGAILVAINLLQPVAKNDEESCRHLNLLGRICFLAKLLIVSSPVVNLIACSLAQHELS